MMPRTDLFILRVGPISFSIDSDPNARTMKPIDRMEADAPIVSCHHLAEARGSFVAFGSPKTAVTRRNK